MYVSARRILKPQLHAYEYMHVHLLMHRSLNTHNSSYKESNQTEKGLFLKSGKKKRKKKGGGGVLLWCRF